MFCGNDVVVASVLRGASGPNIGNLLRLATTAASAGNAAEAERYYTQVLELDGNNVEAWLGKASAVGWQSSLGNIRLHDMLVLSDQALSVAEPETRPETASLAAVQLGNVALAIWTLAAKHHNEHANFEYPDLTARLNNDLAEWARHIFAALDEAIAMLNRNGIADHVIYAAYINLATGFFSFGVSPALQQSISAKIPEYLPRAQKHNPSLQAPTPKSSSCFIATAVYGSSSHPNIELLRNFRDHYLCNWRLGRLIVRVYYVRSPWLAQCVSRWPSLRVVTYAALGICAWLLALLSSMRSRTPGT